MDSAYGMAYGMVVAPLEWAMEGAGSPLDRQTGELKDRQTMGLETRWHADMHPCGWTVDWAAWLIDNHMDRLVEARASG